MTTLINKIGIVGCGNVGMAAASALFQKGLASEIVLIDVDHSRAEGEAMDLMHAQGYASRCEVKAGNFSDLEGANYVVISAGVSQKKGETRIDLLARNIAVFKEIIGKFDSYCPDAILIIATNPVDIMTYAAQQISNRPYQKVIGTGTMLDTSRFKTLLGKYYNIDPKSVHAYVIGEHGDSEVLVWSTTSIAGKLLANQEILGKRLTKNEKETIESNVKNAAYQIINKKGYTSWAIGLVTTFLVQCLENDQKTVFPLSVRLTGEYGVNDVCLGLPCVVGRNGIERTIELDLNNEELAQFQQSASLLTQLKQKLHF